MIKLESEISYLRNLFSLPFENILGFLDRTKEDFIFNSTFSDNSDLYTVSNPDIFYGSFYIHENQIAKVFSDYRNWSISLPSSMDISPFGPPDAELDSRAGRNFTQYIWLHHGFSIATNLHEIGFIEIFHPTTLEDYKAKFWTDPEWDKKINK